MQAGDGDDTVISGGGDDVVHGDGGNDSIEAGAGFDDVAGGDGDDTIYGGIGTDKLFGEGDDDDIYGGDQADSIWGGDGNDELFGEGDSDLLVGGDGADTIDGGQGSDEIDGGEGDDSIIGGDGDDLISTGAGANFVDAGSGDNTVVAGAGEDTLLGGIGADSIEAGGGADLIIGGAGEDYLDGGDGADRITGGTPGVTGVASVGQTPDTVIGGAGDDILSGDSGDDVIDGGADNDSIGGGIGGDTIDGGDGDDVIYGEDTYDVSTGLLADRPADFADALALEPGDDSITAGAGADLVFGQEGDDTITGDAGSDTISGGTGSDDLSGGDDEDTFVIDSAEEGAGDVISGGDGGVDFDTLQLYGTQDVDWRLVDVVTDSDGNGIDGTVEYLDGSGAVTGTTTFTNIEQVVPCFTPGSLIATPKGQRRVEDLQEGDKIITRDNGIQEIRWVGQKRMNGIDLARQPKLQPVLIRKGALGNGLPERDMMVSPNHRVLVTNEKVNLYFNETEVLASAKHLVGLDGIHKVNVVGTTYIHFMFDQHEVVLSDGSWTESFHPGDYTLKGIGRDQRDEILTLFPELKEKEGLDNYQAARRSLKKHEAQILTLKR